MFEIVFRICQLSRQEKRVFDRLLFSMVNFKAECNELRARKNWSASAFVLKIEKEKVLSTLSSIEY